MGDKTPDQDSLIQDRSISDKLPMVIIWMMAITVPLAIIPDSHNSTLIKLLLFTLSAGLLLILLGLKMMKDPVFPRNLPIPLLLLVPAVTLLHQYAPSNPGITRMLLVSSGIGIFISLKVFRIGREKILLPLIAGGSLAILVSILMPSSSPRLAGVFSNANLLGSFAAGLLPVGFAFLLGKGWKRLSLLALFLIVGIWALIMSGTRSNVLALAGAIAAVLIVRWKPKLLKLILILFFAAVFLMVFLPELPVPVFGDTLGVRQVIWEGSSGMFFQKPVFGWGNGSFQLLFPRFRPSDFALRGVSVNTVHAHSEPLEILAENGMIGFLLWSALIILLLTKALRNRKVSLTEWGVITGISVLLLEGLTSVALRWTTSVYLLTILMSLLPAGQHSGMKKLPRWTAILPLAAGLLLLLPGVYKAYRMTRSSVYLNSAMTALANGETAETALELCMESLRNNSWELGSWYTLGNIYGQEAGAAGDLQIAADRVEKQLEAYDSLSVRADDFAWMRVNRIIAFISLGMFDSAMDDVLYLYRHRRDMLDFCLDAGYRITPVVSPGKSFEFMNLVYLDVLAESQQGASDDRNLLMRIDRMESSILTTFALAANYAPDAVDRMKQAADSIMTLCGDPLRNSIMRSIENELQLAVEGYQLLERYSRDDFDGVEQECVEVLSSGEVYATYHRAVQCLMAARNGSTEFVEMAYEYAIVLAEPCSPLAAYYPGAGEIFLAAALISAADGGPEHVLRLQEYCRFAFNIDSFGMDVMKCLGNCLANQPSPDVMNFWLSNGGPQASITFVSSTGRLAPEGETALLLQVSGAESPEFQIAVHFTLSSIAIAAQGADTDFIAAAALLRLQNQHSLLAETHGKEEAVWIVARILSSEIDYLENGFPDAAFIARQLKSAFEAGEI